jgi:hypothetical protein
MSESDSMDFSALVTKIGDFIIGALVTRSKVNSSERSSSVSEDNTEK